MASFLLWTGESLQDPKDGKTYLLPSGLLVAGAPIVAGVGASNISLSIAGQAVSIFTSDGSSTVDIVLAGQAAYIFTSDGISMINIALVGQNLPLNFFLIIEVELEAPIEVGG